MIDGMRDRRPEMTTGKQAGPMRIRLSADRKDALVRALTEMFRQEYDEELSRFRAEQVLQFFLKRLGPSVYNQAIQDACAFMMERVQDLDATYYEKDEDEPPRSRSGRGET